MSGHSKWSQIKRQKEVADKKKSNVFTKLANNLTLATKQGGPDPAMNFKLRLAIDKAREANMPNDIVERAIKRGRGEEGDINIEEVVYEGFGPAGVAIIIEAATDNKNRTTGVIRNILTKFHGHLGNSGSVLWMFDKKGAIRILKNNVPDKESFELKIIDAGAEDIIEEEEGFIIFTAVNDLAKIKGVIEKAGMAIESAELEMVPKNKTAADQGAQETLSRIYDELDACDDVNNYFTNAEI